ncbi:hypothetical protein GBA52_027451 [Prunus armeniaca]|nr:hypothetical protein GBA52_027451 [Prunus armeniaca]
MEGHMSKKSPETSSAINLGTNLQDTTDQLSSGEAAFKIDAGLHSFDTNQELFELVEKYLENSLRTLDSCTALEKCLKRARASQSFILVSLQQFEKETEIGGNRYSRTLEELNKFKEIGDPFTKEYFQIFQSVYMQQTLMLEKLELPKNKLDKELNSIHAAAMAGPPVAAALAAVYPCSLNGEVD